MTNVALVLASSRHCATAWAASSGGGPPIPAGVEALGDDVAAIAAWLERPTSQDDGRSLHGRCRRTHAGRDPWRQPSDSE